MITTSRDLTVTLTVASAEDSAQPAASAEAHLSCEPWTDSTGRQLGHGFGDRSSYQINLYGIGRFLFLPHSGDVRGIRGPGVRPEAFEDAFRRWIAPAFLQWRGWEVLHASGLVVSDSLAVLCGDSESGKSTLAHAWHRRGGGVIADDAVPFRMEGRSACVGSIPFRIRLRPPTVRYFGAATAGDVDHVTTGRPWPADEGRLRSIYLLHRRQEGEGVVSLEPLSPEDAFPALLHHACSLTLRDPVRNLEMMDSYITLANAVPVLRLSYPTGLHHVESVLDRLTEDMSIRVSREGQRSETTR